MARIEDTGWAGKLFRIVALHDFKMIAWIKKGPNYGNLWHSYLNCLKPPSFDGYGDHMKTLDRDAS